MKCCLPAIGLLLCGLTSASHAQRVIDNFDHGVTQVSISGNGFGVTTAPGILADFAEGNPARYYSWVSAGALPVVIDNQSFAGHLLLSHGGSGDGAYVNLSYLFSAPADFRAFGQILIRGSGSGFGRVSVALEDADGDVLIDRQPAQTGSFATLTSQLATMSCLGLGNGACGLDRVTMLEYRVEGFGGQAWRQDIDEISVASLSTLTAPIPEPGTWALMGLGLAALTVIRRRIREKS